MPSQARVWARAHEAKISGLCYGPDGGRSFATADEIIFREAVRDAAAKQVYKGLAAIHEAFGQLGDMAQEIANGTNASRELQSRIDELAAREYGDAIDRLSKDLVAIAK